MTEKERFGVEEAEEPETAEEPEPPEETETPEGPGTPEEPETSEWPGTSEEPETPSSSQPLAVIVDDRQTDVAIESLRVEGVYDDARHIRPFEDGLIAIPVTEPPAETDVRDVVHQVDPEYRPTDLETLLAERGWSEDELERTPGSWAVIGDVILVRFPSNCPDERAVADALLELHGGAETVLANEGVRGIHRTPQTRHVRGATDTETTHVEAGTRYTLDPARVMFSPGNQAERIRMGEVVEAGERVFDMFAGIGYFTHPMARAGADVTATELNPTAFRYLLENAVANEVTGQIAAYNTDCRDVAGAIDADRVVMGYYGVAAEPDDGIARGGAGRAEANSGETDSETADRTETAETFLPAALSALEPGGTIHFHDACPVSLLPDRPIDRFTTAVERAGRVVESVDVRQVKTHSEGVVHVVVDAVVD